jgi:hypothetical protein
MTFDQLLATAQSEVRQARTRAADDRLEVLIGWGLRPAEGHRRRPCSCERAAGWRGRGGWPSRPTGRVAMIPPSP